MSQPSPNLLTLPTEVRLKILHYAIYVPSPTHFLPNAISVFWPRAFNDPDKYKPSFYGTTSMSALFVLSRLLHSELEEILFTRFIFSFPHYTRLPSVKDFTTVISLRARTLLREIMVGIHLDLGFDETEAFITRHNQNKLLPARESLIYLKKELPGLRKLHLSIGFVSGPLSGVLVKRRVDEFADMAIGLVAMFVPDVEVVVANNDHQQCRKDVMQVCREKLAKLMTSTGPNPLQDGLCSLKLSDADEVSSEKK